VPVVSTDEKIYSLNDRQDTPSFVVAWGSNGGSENAKNRAAVIPGNIEVVAPGL
jgi:hypothetical protein